MPSTSLTGPCRFTKSQKRASILLSDVSQSLFAALSSPSTPSPPTHPSRLTASSPLSISTNANPFLATISPMSASPSPVPSGGSLLEDDEFGEQGIESGKSLGEVLIPVSLSPAASPLVDPKITGANTTQPASTSSLDDDDDDWNW